MDELLNSLCTYTEISSSIVGGVLVACVVQTLLLGFFCKLLFSCHLEDISSLFAKGIKRFRDNTEQLSDVQDQLSDVQDRLRRMQIHQQVLLDFNYRQQGSKPEEQLERLAIQSEVTHNLLLAASFASPEMWSRPLYEILSCTGWRYTWNTFEIAETYGQRYVLQLLPPSYCYVYLDVPYQNITFIQSIRNKWTYYCFYGSKLIGFYKIRGKRRSPGKFLREVCLKPNTWLISSRALREYSVKHYSSEAFEKKVIADYQTPLYIYSEANLEVERKLLAQGRHHPEATYMSFINLMFCLFIYQSFAQKVEYLYGHQLYADEMEESEQVHYDDREYSIHQYFPDISFPRFDEEAKDLRDELLRHNYSFIPCDED